MLAAAARARLADHERDSIAATPSRSHRAYDANVKRIDCACGQVIEAEDDDELWEKAQAHLRTDHPDLVGKVSRKDILAQAEEIRPSS